MSSTHPRRSQKTTLSPMTLQSMDKSLALPQSLRKGTTFYTPPTLPTSDQSLVLPCLPRRSQTSLEDIVEAHKRRVAITLDDIERGLSTLNLDITDSTAQSFPDDGLPVPQGVLKNTVNTRHQQTNISMSPIAPDAADPTISRHSLRTRRQARRQSVHTNSDSGLGSSIMSAPEQKPLRARQQGERNEKSNVSVAAITRPLAPHQPSFENLPRLSDRATIKFRQFIFEPLLAKPSLKDFHSLVNDCPRRIRENEIACLRDLEKTLMLMAPERSKTATSYFEFCFESIRCIQATVEHLSERELTKANDRPYTSGYFIDLVDQIRNHAKAIKASQEKTASGESLDKMDVDGSQQIKLFGGIHKNGRPAELVRINKDGKAISMATGKEVPMDSIEDDEKGVRIKRSLSVEEDDESVRRSMARRKASAAPEPPKVCSHNGCGKVFKRACDLTKHEKTHSRPWKCQDTNCKYHEYGWPTEKELDRHINDKHSASPKLYKCLFPPCAYQSKRESNCKQHMEKSHNWVYVRSKNNGKNRDEQSNRGGALPTPQGTNMQTPVTEYHPSPETSNFGDMSGFNGSPNFNQDHFNDSALDMPQSYASDFHYHGDLQMNQPGTFHISPADSNLQYSSNESSPYLQTIPGFPTDSVTANFGNGNDFTLYENLYDAHVMVPEAQLPTPEKSIFSRSYDATPAFMDQAVFSTNTTNNCMPHLSPVGQPDLTLYTPASMMDLDDSFEIMPTTTADCLGNDFDIFAACAGSAMVAGQQGDLFGEIPSTGLSQFTGEWQDFYAQPPVNGEWFMDEGMRM